MGANSGDFFRKLPLARENEGFPFELLQLLYTRQNHEPKLPNAP